MLEFLLSIFERIVKWAKMFSLPCTECDEMSVVGRSWDRDRPCTTDVGVAELVGEALKLVGFESAKD